MSADTPEHFEDLSQNPALKTVLLPQYQASETANELFLDVIHSGNLGLERSPNALGIKMADSNELQADAYSYFIENKQQLEQEFLTDLIESIGRDKANEFCNVIARDWFAGAVGRRKPSIAGLKAGVRDYISALLRGKPLDGVVIDSDALLPPSTFTSFEISRVLTVNDRLMLKHVEQWKTHHSGFPNISTDEIFLRRGLGLEVPLVANDIYREMDFISSYSMAFTASEKFAQMQSHLYSSIVNGDIELFRGRILFFSPFVPNMPGEQLEVGVIPALTSLRIKDQGSHGGIHEYILDPRPFDR